MPKPKKKRIAEPGKRHRAHDGPNALEVTAKAPPPLSQRGTLHVHTHAIIEGGPEALLAKDKTAQILAREHGEAYGAELKAQWTWETPWILRNRNAMRLVDSASPRDAHDPSDPQRSSGSVASCDATAEPPRDVDGNVLALCAGRKLRRDNRAHERATYAMQWRPTFLATVALAHSVMIGCNAAKVSDKTVREHREADPDFDAQVEAAQAHCIQLLHSVTMRDAIEGIIEPIYWQGIEVGHVRKVDNRLRIEMLRAHMPQTFKTPGSKVQVNTGNNLFLGDGQVADQQAVFELQAMRQRSLDRMREKKANAREVGTLALPAVPPTP